MPRKNSPHEQRILSSKNSDRSHLIRSGIALFGFGQICPGSRYAIHLKEPNAITVKACPWRVFLFAWNTVQIISENIFGSKYDLRTNSDRLQLFVADQQSGEIGEGQESALFRVVARIEVERVLQALEPTGGLQVARKGCDKPTSTLMHPKTLTHPSMGTKKHS